ncbi:MAG: response regulator [Solirubrobacteraceae bacterium]
MDSAPDMTALGEAANGEEAVGLARHQQPDVVLMDIRMPGTDGIEATRLIKSDTATAGVKVLILTTFDLDEYVYAALRAGASGFLLKDAQPADLLSAIRAVGSGDAVVAPSITRRLLDTYAHRLATPAGGEGPVDRLRPAQREQLEQLTAREREVLLLVARSMSNAEIAEQLVLSEATVKSHVGRILAKLDLRDRVQIVVFAYESGLVRPARG